MANESVLMEELGKLDVAKATAKMDMQARGTARAKEKEEGATCGNEASQEESASVVGFQVTSRRSTGT